MTVDQAAALILRDIGPRPIKVTPDNRKHVRRWLAARGLPRMFVDGLSKAELQCAYNDAAGSDAGFKSLQHKLAIAKRESDDTDDTDDVDFEREIVGDSEAKQTSSAMRGDAGPSEASLTLEAAIRAIAESTTPKAPLLDEAKVAAIVDKRIAETATVRHVIELRNASGKAREITGQHKTFPALLRAMSSRMANGFHPNIMLVGPTGSGKTHGAKAAADAMGLEFRTNGAITQDYQLIGYRDAHGHYHETALRQAFGSPAAYLFDEIDASDNSPLLCLSGALANGGFQFPDAFVERHPDSVIIAAGNTFGNGATADFVGRAKLDGAVRSRFPVRIVWDYDEELERAIAGNEAWARRVQAARAKARQAGLKIIIDPRMTQAGAALIAAGMSPDEAAQMTYLADLTPDQRRMVA